MPRGCGHDVRPSGSKRSVQLVLALGVDAEPEPDQRREPEPQPPTADQGWPMQSVVQQRSSVTEMENSGLRRTSMDEQQMLEQNSQTFFRLSSRWNAECQEFEST
jgi:hypothetical protein